MKARAELVQIGLLAAAAVLAEFAALVAMWATAA